MQQELVLKKTPKQKKEVLISKKLSGLYKLPKLENKEQIMRGKWSGGQQTVCHLKYKQESKRMQIAENLYFYLSPGD